MRDVSAGSPESGEVGKRSPASAPAVLAPHGPLLVIPGFQAEFFNPDAYVVHSLEQSVAVGIDHFQGKGSRTVGADSPGVEAVLVESAPAFSRPHSPFVGQREA